MNKEKLINRWTMLLTLSSNEQTLHDKREKYEDLLFKLFKLYEDGKRFYHTIEHIEHMLFKIDELTNYYSPEYLIIELATFFHDIYYDPANVNKSASNEFLSSVIARRELRNLNINEKIICNVEDLIRLTENHKINLDIPISKDAQEIFLDADMSILGETPEIYKEYSDNIAKEYLNPKILPNSKVYYTKRKEFLSKTLENKHIFYTIHMQTHYEAQARLNMQDEIVRLDKLLTEESQ